MSIKKQLADPVVRRLPGYYRYLTALEKEGKMRISSQQLAERMGLTASQIRQDINCFGGFGQQGFGYEVSRLREHIGNLLGTYAVHKMILLGAGNIGAAVANYAGFSEENFLVAAVFDSDAEKVGQVVGAQIVRPMDTLEAYLAENDIDIGVIATPASCAQSIAEQLERGGVKAIWNFAPIDLDVRVAVNNVHLADSLLVLSYRMQEKTQGGNP